MHIWEQAKEVKIQTGEEIVGNFSLGFDKKISEEVKNAMIDFVYWVEDHYPVPVTLWVDFKYNHYLVTGKKQRVGYKFYWVDFDAYPAFEKEEDIPVIELPVRTECWTMEEILASFIEAITCYFAWLTNQMQEGFRPDPDQVEEILQMYLQSKED